MTPPINIDGTQITGASIDGQDVSEITADGDVVFSAIPDSAIHRWPFEEGSGDTLPDTIGTADGTRNGATWVSGNFQGDFALDGNGTDESTEFPPEIVSGLTDFSIAYTIETTQSSTYWFGVADGDPRIAIQHNFGVTGDVRCFGRDDSISDNSVFSGDQNLNDGNEHRIVIMIPSDSAPEVSIDGSQITPASQSGSGFGGFTPTIDWYFHTYNNNGSEKNHLNGVVDDPIIYDSILTSSELSDDHAAQPWA